jgi:hypothetical protein
VYKGPILHAEAEPASSLEELMRRIGFLTFICLIGLLVASASPQDEKAAMQERLAQLKESQAQNKKNLATYTWQEQDTISLKGEVKKVEKFQVKNGPDGKAVKTPMDAGAASAAPPEKASGGRGGRLKEHVVEKKKEEFSDYAHQIAALAQEYAKPDPAKIEEAKNAGNVKLGPGKMSDEVAIFLTNYIKPNDSMTITFNKNEKAIQNVQIASYLDDPKDAVRIMIQFAKLPDGTNHVASMVIDGESKQLNIAVQNSNYNKM